MSERQKKLFDEFELRMRQLMFLCDSLKEQNAALRQEIQTKNTVIDSLTVDMEQLKRQYDNLKFVKAFSSGNKDEMQSAKQRLSKLVRDVDKCIALLKT